MMKQHQRNSGPSRTSKEVHEEFHQSPDTPEPAEGEGVEIEFQHELLDHFLEHADELGRHHDEHTSEAVNRIEGYERTQEEYKVLVEDSNANHEERRTATEQIVEHTKDFDSYTKDSAIEKRALRAEFDDNEDALRKLKDQILETEIENKNLQLIAETEQSIQDAKDRAESDAVQAVNSDLKDMVGRLSNDAETDISYQEVSQRIKLDVDANLGQSKLDFEKFIQQTDAAREELIEDLNELKERSDQRNQDNDELRNRIEEGEVETDRLNHALENLNREIDNLKRENEAAISDLEKTRKDNEKTIAELHKNAEELKHEHSKLEVGILKINSQLQYLDEAGKSGGNDLIKKKIAKFERNIHSTNRGTEQLKNHLDGMNRDWIARIEAANRELSNLIRDTESKSASDKLNQLLQELQSKQNEIEELKRRRNQLERELANTDPEGTDREIQAQSLELDDVNEQLIAILRENNKTEIARLRMEIETARREQEEKGVYFSDLIAQIDERRALLEELQYEITENESILHQLEETLQLRREEGDELDKLLAERDDEVRRLEAKLAELNKNRPVTPEEIVEPESVYVSPEDPLKKYVADKSDEVDILLARYININDCPVPIKRLGGGYYLFGTRKIYAKVMNGRLVIRVGGGYMVIDEFIETYAEAELKKMDARKAKGLDAVPDISDMSPSNRSFGSSGGRASPKSRTMKKRNASPRNGKTYSAKGSSALNGTTRTKQFTQAQIDKMISSGAAKDYRR